MERLFVAFQAVVRVPARHFLQKRDRAVDRLEHLDGVLARDVAGAEHLPIGKLKRRAVPGPCDDSKHEGWRYDCSCQDPRQQS